jgi:conjugative relaxase-like TrwC/TraI family protein
MLTVAKVTANVAAGYADYLEGKTRTSTLGDYYLKDGERVEAPGRWVSTPLGAEPGDTVVSPEVVRELMAVRHPATGQPLRRVGASGEAVAALDATFSAPKSVSAVWAIADPELRAAIETAHEQAINRAVRYAVKQVPMVRQRLDADTVSHVTARDVVATSWRHSTARSVDGQAPDPQLHSHVLLHAAVRADGMTVAIDSRAWLLHRRELGAAYRTELAREMSQLGFEIHSGTGRGGRYFEIAGVPQELMDRWSSRHRQVQEAIERRLAERADGSAQLSPAEERAMAVISRAGKQPVTAAELDHQWSTAGAAAGFGADDLERLRRPDRLVPEPVSADQLAMALTEFDATFTDREARAVALERSAGAPIADSIATLERARSEGWLLPLASGKSTTAQHRAMERSVLAGARRISHEPGEPVPAKVVKASADRVNQRLRRGGGKLSAEQERALMLATGERRIVMIEGQAGTGKSTALQAVALAHQADGREVIVTSTGALAAQRLAADLNDAGVPAPAYSTAGLQHALSNGDVALSERSTVIHDEAALSSTREQRQLLDAVEQSGARLILVGDPEQSKPVGAGGLWDRLETQMLDHNAIVELTENLRARDPLDRRDQLRFRRGDREEALHGYDGRSRVHLGVDQVSAEELALVAGHQDRRAGQQTMVIAQTSNDRLDELNARAQSLRRADGELGDASLPVPGRPYRLYAGDEIQIRHNVTVGDRRLQNGTMANVTSINERGASARLRLADGSELSLDRAQLQRADARLAYVQHPFPAQGATSDTAHLIVAEHATREGSYVAITRAREQTHIYASQEALTQEGGRPHLSALAEILSREEPEVPSIATPLAHEREIERNPTQDRHGDSPEPVPEPTPEPAAGIFTERLRQREAGAEPLAAEREVSDDAGWEL